MRKLAMVGMAAIVLAACNGGGGDTTTTQADGGTATSPAPTTTSAPAPTDPTVADATITISGFSFGPQLTVSVGDTVAATNEDALPHTWTSTDGLWNSGTLSGDTVFHHTFDEPGEFDFFCSIHPGDMRGTIIVEG